MNRPNGAAMPSNLRIARSLRAANTGDAITRPSAAEDRSFALGVPTDAPPATGMRDVLAIKG
jgi:hypothetical protein